MGRIVDYPIADNVANKDNVFINQDNELKQISVANVLAPVRHDYADLYNDVQSLKLQEYEQAEATYTLTDTLNGSIKMREYKGMTHKSKNLIVMPNPYSITGTYAQVVAINVKKNTQYVLSAKLVSKTVYAGISIRTTNNTTIIEGYSSPFGLRFNSGENEQINIFFYSGNANSGTSIYEDIMLNEGTEALPYEPYGMRSTGDMGLVDLGDLNYTKYDTSSGTLFRSSIITGIKKVTTSTEIPNLYCEEYATSSSNARTNKTISMVNNAQTIDIIDNGFTDTTAFKNAMQGVKLIFEVADGATPSQYGIVIKEHGKNLFNPKDILYGTYTEDVWNIPYPSAKALNFKFEENTQYTFSAYVSQFKGNDGRYANVRFLIYYTDGTQSDLVLLAPSENPVYLTFTSRSGKTIESLWATYGSGSAGAYASYRNFQIERGTQATSYTPYQGKTVFIPISQPLHTEDKLYKVDGKYKEYHKMAEVDLGSLSWSKSTYDRYISSIISDAKAPANSNVVANIIANGFNVTTKNTVELSNNNIALDANKTVYICDKTHTDLDSFKNNLKGVKLVYELATPTLTDAIDQTSFYELEAYDEQTTIELESVDGFNALGSMAYEYAIHETTQMAMNGEQLGELNSIEIEEAKDSFANMFFNNAGSHNSLYRGKYLGNALTDAQKKAIANGTFEDLFIGDYWTINGVNYRIAHFDYWLRTGDIECTKHHVVIVPDSNLYNAKMNDTNTTVGAYVGSKMYTENLAQAKITIANAFGNTNILLHREYLANATKATSDPTYETVCAWYDSAVELMNERMVYGADVLHNVEVNGAIPANFTIDKSQLALFRLDTSMIFNRVNSWLRDVVSSMRFALIYSQGFTNEGIASNSFGVRPVFGIVGD